MEGAQAPSLAIVGAGRAGSALAIAAHEAGYVVAAVASRRGEVARLLADTVGAEAVATPLAAAASADLTLLAVPDNAITSVAATIAASGIALHGRGIVHLGARFGPGVIASLRTTGAEVGVLHPLQALAGPGSASLLEGASFRIDATGGLRPRLLAFVDALGARPLEIDPSQAPLYHAAAVLAGNAPLALLAEATRLLEAAGVSRADAHEALAALLEGAARNARRAGAAAALTGPVARGDSDAITAHLEVLAAHPEARDLYLHLTRAMESLVGDPTDQQAAAGSQVA
ncbi:MAG TPA: DUF2520 domain-containing protein [Candidatus Saccharimonadales bacterium]|nr:DUF2520 domain-containing protein [Candidatus Saccharimonadales bacterium]